MTYEVRDGILLNVEMSALMGGFRSLESSLEAVHFGKYFDIKGSYYFKNI